MISDIVATGWKGGVCAMAGLARRSNARIRIMPPSCSNRPRRPSWNACDSPVSVGAVYDRPRCLTSRSWAVIDVIDHPYRRMQPRAEYESNRGLLILFFRVRFKRIRGRHEELSPVREGKIPAVEAPQAVFREIASDYDLRSQGQRILIESSPEHRIRSASFDFPGLYG